MRRRAIYPGGSSLRNRRNGLQPDAVREESIKAPATLACAERTVADVILRSGRKLIPSSAVERLMADNQFWRNAVGRLTFSMGRVPADSYRLMCEAVAAEFGLVPHTDLITDGLALVFQDYRRGEQVIGLEWDNWMGYTVVAKASDSEPLVQDIAAWLIQSPWATEG